MIELKGATLFPHAMGTFVMADEPQECTKCHIMTHFFDNRGQTYCWYCVDAGQKEERNS